MKTITPVVLTFCLVLIVQESFGQQRQRPFGLGVIIGEPTGISAKYWTSQTNALDFGLGWSVGGDRIGRYGGNYSGGSRIHFHADYLWHSFDAIHSIERFPLYYGIGAHLNSGAGYDNSLAVRGVFGIEWLPHNTPMDLFLEIVPALQLTNTTVLVLDAGFGVRYFF